MEKGDLEKGDCPLFCLFCGIPVTFDGLGITFEQEYKGPYIELGTNYDYKSFDFSIALKYSPIISVEYTDTHHMRTPPFTETTKFDDTSMTSINVGANYIINVNQIIGLSYEYTKYAYVRGDRTRAFEGASTYTWTNSTGIESKNSIINLTYSYKF